MEQSNHFQVLKGGEPYFIHLSDNLLPIRRSELIQVREQSNVFGEILRIYMFHDIIFS